MHCFDCADLNGRRMQRPLASKSSIKFAYCSEQYSYRLYIFSRQRPAISYAVTKRCEPATAVWCLSDRSAFPCNFRCGELQECRAVPLPSGFLCGRDAGPPTAPYCFPGRSGATIRGPGPQAEDFRVGSGPRIAPAGRPGRQGWKRPQNRTARPSFGPAVPSPSSRPSGASGGIPARSQRTEPGVRRRDSSTTRTGVRSGRNDGWGLSGQRKNC